MWFVGMIGGRLVHTAVSRRRFPSTVRALFGWYVTLCTQFIHIHVTNHTTQCSATEAKRARHTWRVRNVVGTEAKLRRYKSRYKDQVSRTEHHTQRSRQTFSPCVHYCNYIMFSPVDLCSFIFIYMVLFMGRAAARVGGKPRRQCFGSREASVLTRGVGGRRDCECAMQTVWRGGAGRGWTGLACCCCCCCCCHSHLSHSQRHI